MFVFVCFRLSSIFSRQTDGIQRDIYTGSNIDNQDSNVHEYTRVKPSDYLQYGNPVLVSDVLPGFQKVDHAQDLWIYSVFYEYKNPATELPGIRAIGMISVKHTRFDATEHPTFHLTFPNGKTSSVGGREEKLRFDGRWSECDVEYANVVLECDLPSGVHPDHVAFSWSDNSTWSHSFQVTYPDLSRKRTLTMCYGVLYGGFSDHDAVLQNIEYNRLMGVEHFYIYNQSVGAGVEAVFQFYIQQGFLTVLQMPNEIPAKFSWYHGQQVSIQDCHTRNRYTSTYVIVQDTDEFIMPSLHSSFTEVIEFVEKNLTDLIEKSEKESRFFLSFLRSSFPNVLDLVGKHFVKKQIESDVFQVHPKGKRWTTPQAVHDDIAGFSFQHAYFTRLPASRTELQQRKDMFGMSAEDYKFADDTGIRIIKETKHARFLEFGQKQKMIIRPDLVILHGTHNTYSRKPNTVELRVNHSVAFLAHHSMKDIDVKPELHFHPRPFYKTYLDIIKRRREEFVNFVTMYNVKLNKGRELRIPKKALGETWNKLNVEEIKDLKKDKGEK